MAKLKVATVHRNIETRQRWLFGYEPADFWLLVGLFFALMALFRDLFFWNLLLVATVATALRTLKRNKPPGFTQAFLRFSTRGPFFSAAAPDSTRVPFLVVEGAKGKTEEHK